MSSHLFSRTDLGSQLPFQYVPVMIVSAGRTAHMGCVYDAISPRIAVALAIVAVIGDTAR